jgi:hypothetical protein
MNQRVDMNKMDAFDEIYTETDIDVAECLNYSNIEAKEEFLQSDSLVRPNNRFDNIPVTKIRSNIVRLSGVIDDYDGVERELLQLT